MEEISTEQKLQLVQQIRNQYHRNRYDMSNRERILYGRTDEIPAMNADNKTTMSESLRFRCAVASIIFIFAVVFDIFDVHPCGLEMDHIFTYIAADYQEDIVEYVETISNTTDTISQN